MKDLFIKIVTRLKDLDFINKKILSWLSPRDLNGLLAAKPRPQRTLVKARPTSLQERYKPVENDTEADNIFRDFRNLLFQRLDRLKEEQASLPPILRESGRLPQNRPYFFLKPLNREGWLFERSGTGFVISRADKIVGRDLFLRRHDPWDIVSIYRSTVASGRPRVTSQKIGNDLLSFLAYEQKIINSLDLGIDGLI